MTTWLPGIRCVCIEEFPWLEDVGVAGPLKGQVYTVAQVQLCSVSGRIGLVLAEIDLSMAFGRDFIFEGHLYEIGVDAGLDAGSFRPLSETRLDQFRVHLAPMPCEVA